MNSLEIEKSLLSIKSEVSKIRKDVDALRLDVKKVSDKIIGNGNISLSGNKFSVDRTISVSQIINSIDAIDNRVIILEAGI